MNITRKQALLFFGVIALVGTAVFIFWPRSVIWNVSGKPGVITVQVIDQDERPISGVNVCSESFSGTTAEQLTDSRGNISIVPGEAEVLALYVDDAKVFNRDWGVLTHIAAPTCRKGLAFTVRVHR